MKTVRTLALLALGLGVAGCGVAEYEEKMRGAQMKAQLYDEENKLLEGPLNAPKQTDPKTNQTSDVAQVFFRPPKGIAVSPAKERVDRLRYRYPATQTGGAFVGLDAAFAEGKDDLAKLAASWFPTEQVPALRKVELGSHTFETTEFISAVNNARAVYVTPKQKDKTQMALVFYMDASKKASAQRALDLSLKSLALGGEALARRADYQKPVPWASPEGTKP